MNGRTAWRLLLLLAVAKLTLHLFAVEQYGYFRDELYYLASTEHLDWGYVDHPPLSIAVLAAVRFLIGDSLPALRLVPALAGAATVVLFGLVAHRLGGGRFAQGLAALVALLCPTFLGTHHYYSMNAIDLLLWSLGALLVLRVLEKPTLGGWSALGVLGGLALLNKPSALWYGGSLFIGLLVTHHRRVLRTPGPWVAAALAALVFLPNVLWQVRHGWPTQEWMRNASTYKMVATGPLRFVLDQILAMNPGAVPVWIAGLSYGLFGRGEPLRRGGRVLFWMYVVIALLLMMSGRSRPYYLAVTYIMVLPLGAVALEQRVETRALRAALAVLVVLFGALILPFALPVLPVRTFVRYQAALGQEPRTDEHHEMGALPQQYADMFGWPEMVALVHKAYLRLTPDERAHCRIFGQNYGEAGAVDVLGRKLGLPPAVSGHNSYWLWGPRPGRVDAVIIIGGDRADNARFFESIEIVGQTSSPWAMPYERGLDVSIGRRPKVDLRQLWPELRRYI
ncbi:MAG TPA: glycosyltransferase family 39 protein [Candidatus Polarisedimenticolaceae bacterium]|nr:glycosyltransferase family 39 protein [Candidatus Polarisedimenticolaceae bacterium]